MVDDDAAVRLLLRHILSSDGFQSDLAANVEQALELLDLNGQGLLITDLNMPGRSGMDLIRDVRSQSANFPILVVSSDLQALEQCRTVPKLECLPKPFDLSALRAAMKRLMSKND